MTAAVEYVPEELPVILPSQGGELPCWPTALDRDFCCQLHDDDPRLLEPRCFLDGISRHRSSCCNGFDFYTFRPMNCWLFQLDKLATCCQLGPEDAAELHCFGDMRTRSFCCSHFFIVPPSSDDCPWPERWEDFVLQEPSQQRPFLLLRDQKVGGQTLQFWLQRSLIRLQKLGVSQVHPPVHGIPFLLKFRGDVLHKLEIVSGHFDWRVFSSGIKCMQRQRVHSLILLRNPVDRFISFYEERTDRKFEQQLNRSMKNWTRAELRYYLRMISGRKFSGDEPLLFCEDHIRMCMTGITSRRPLHVAKRGEQVPEQKYFRAFMSGGPLNSLAWMLDPEMGSEVTAIARIKWMLVGLLVERFNDFLEVLAFFLPWLREPWGPDGRLGRLSTHVGARANVATQRQTRKLPSHLRREIARWNSKDMAIYAQGVRQFELQLAHARHQQNPSGSRPVLPFIDRWESEDLFDRAWSESFLKARPQEYIWTSACQGRCFNATLARHFTNPRFRQPRRREKEKTSDGLSQGRRQL